MRILLASGPPTVDRIGANTADALKDNESQALIVLAVIGGAIVVIAILAFVFRKKTSPARR